MTGPPVPGRCGRELQSVFGGGRCRLFAGHPGWHHGDTGTEWRTDWAEAVPGKPTVGVTVALTPAEARAVAELSDGLPPERVLRFWLEDALLWAQRFAVMRRAARDAGEKYPGNLEGTVVRGESPDDGTAYRTWNTAEETP